MNAITEIVESIVADPHSVSTIECPTTYKEVCAQFNVIYANQRKDGASEARQALANHKERIGELIKKAQGASLVDRCVSTYFDLVSGQCANSWLSGLAGDNRKARELSNFIFDCYDVFTGFESQALLDEQAANPKFKACNEHYQSRQRSATFIYQTVRESAMNGNPISFQQFIELIHEACKVHKVTPKENMLLVNAQKSPDYAWQDAYKACNIPLIKTGEPMHEVWDIALALVANREYTGCEEIENMIKTYKSIRKTVEHAHKDEADVDSFMGSAMEAMELITDSRTAFR